MRLTVIGAGYLGLTHAVSMAELGHQVLALDVDQDRVASAARSEPPFFEPSLEPRATRRTGVDECHDGPRGPHIASRQACSAASSSGQ
jgi:UDP-glucose 6-dehydrogenase